MTLLKDSSLDFSRARALYASSEIVRVLRATGTSVTSVYLLIIKRWSKQIQQFAQMRYGMIRFVRFM